MPLFNVSFKRVSEAYWKGVARFLIVSTGMNGKVKQNQHEVEILKHTCTEIFSGLLRKVVL